MINPINSFCCRRFDWLIYGLALVLPVITLWIRMELPVSFGQRPLLILFMPGILLIAMLGGFWPGLLASLNACAVTAYFLIPPIGQFWIEEDHDLFQWGMLLLSGGIASTLAGWQRHAHTHAIAQQRVLDDAQVRLMEKTISEIHLQTLFDGAPDAILVSDTQGRIVQINQRAIVFFGYSQDQLVGQSIDILVPDCYRSGHAGHRADYLAHPVARPMGTVADLAARCSDGREVPISVSLNTYHANGQTYVISAVRDVSALRQIELDLHHSRERLGIAANAGQIGIWDYDVIDNILIWDDWMYRIYGIDRNQFSGAYDAWSNSVHPDDLPPAAEALQATIRNEAPFATCFRIIRPDGTERWIKAGGIAIPDPQGSVRRIIGTNIDVTDEVEIQHNLESTLKDLAASNRALSISNKELDAFAYSVSHDLRAPLRAMRGFSDILIEEHADQLDDQGHDFLKRIKVAAQRMGQLIDDMLTLSRISRAELSRNHFDISAVVAEAAANLREAFPDRDIELVVLPGLQAYGDPKLMRIVLDNLLGNAWKFTAKTEHAWVEFGCEIHDGKIEYFVRDNGAGFDMAYAGKLFTAFQRLHSAGEFPGSGIGLATVARVIHKHGGTVRAESTVGQGAAFWFSLQP